MMHSLNTELLDLTLVTTTSFQDQRGSFSRLFCQNALTKHMESRHIVQINHSQTEHLGTVRGLHYQQHPHAEMKIVRCIKGRIWDVAVDIRPHSKTFMQWHAQELSAQNMHMLMIPEGFAHGFQSLEEDSHILYLHTTAYHPEAEAGIRHDDPNLAIQWPITITELSERDAQLPFSHEVKL